MARRYRRYRRMSGAFGGFRGLRGGLSSIVPTMSQVKTFAAAGVAGAAGVAATTQLVNRVMNKVDSGRKVPSWGRSLIGIALGLVGARLLLNWNRDAAVGFAGGVVGYGVAKLVMDQLGQPLTFGGLRGRGVRGLQGADIATFKPGRPRLAPVQKSSPVAGLAGAVISSRRVPSYLS